MEWPAELSPEPSAGYARGMSRYLFRRLRRCRALFALALCAWLSLASVVWAQADCCATADMTMSMSMPHASDLHGHAADHDHATVPGSCCPHAASVFPSAMPEPTHGLAYATHWQVRRVIAPQPVYEPPLRPPVA